MHVLVSGADGFVGTHLVSGLRAAGHRVTALVFGRAAQDETEIRVDLRKKAELSSLPEGVTAVVHTAGIVDPGAPSSLMYAVNVQGTANLVAWSLRHRVRHFVHLSSIAVYGPLLLGEDREETTPRVGRLLGIPYMRSKAQAEVCVERSGLGYTFLRPPAILGSGDTIITRGFMDALGGEGVPLVPHASPGRRVSLAFAPGVVEVALRALDRGPLHGAVHVVDAELSLYDLAQIYARQLGKPCVFSKVSWTALRGQLGDAGFQWLLTSARFGQHYSRHKLFRELGYRSAIPLENAVAAGISSLQGISGSLF